MEFLAKKNEDNCISERFNSFRDKVMVRLRNFFKVKRAWTVEYNIYCAEMKVLIESMT